MSTKFPFLSYQFIFPCVLFLSRFLFRPLEGIWRDWVVIISIYWMGVTLKPSLRMSQPFVVGTMLYLMGVYLAGQLGYSLSLLGNTP